MNDEPPLRLRPGKSKHDPNENRRKYTGVLRSMLRLMQMSKRDKKRAAHKRGENGQAGQSRSICQIKAPTPF